MAIGIFFSVILKVGEYYNALISDKIVLRDIASNSNTESGAKISFSYKVKGGLGFNHFHRSPTFLFSSLNICLQNIWLWYIWFIPNREVSLAS